MTRTDKDRRAARQARRQRARSREAEAARLFAEDLAEAGGPTLAELAAAAELHKRLDADDFAPGCDSYDRYYDR